MALHHDSHEAYTCDLPSPLKARLEPAYSLITARLDAVIAERFGYAQLASDPSAREVVKEADRAVFCVEADALIAGDVAVPDVRDRVLSAARWASSVEKAWGHAMAAGEFRRAHARWLKAALDAGRIARDHRRPADNRAATAFDASRVSSSAAEHVEVTFQSDLLSTAGRLLVAAHRTPTASFDELGAAVGIDRRHVGRLLDDLERGGYLTRERVGRRNRYTIQLEHRVSRSATVSELLALFERPGGQEP